MTLRNGSLARVAFKHANAPDDDYIDLDGLAGRNGLTTAFPKDKVSRALPGGFPVVLELDTRSGAIGMTLVRTVQMDQLCADLYHRFGTLRIRPQGADEGLPQQVVDVVVTNVQLVIVSAQLSMWTVSFALTGAIDAAPTPDPGPDPDPMPRPGPIIPGPVPTPTNPILYMVGVTHDALYRVNTDDGTAQRIDPQLTDFGTAEVTSPGDITTYKGRMWLVDPGFRAAGQQAQNDALFEVFPNTGAARRVGSAPAGFGVREGRPQGLAGHETLGLFMVGEDQRRLYKLDEVTGLATAVNSSAPAGFGVTETRPQSLEFVGDVLYMVGQTTDQLYTLDTTTGLATQIGRGVGFGVNEDLPSALGYHGGKMYFTGHRTDRLFTLNLSTGIASPVGQAVKFGPRANEEGPSGLTSYPKPTTGDTTVGPVEPTPTDVATLSGVRAFNTDASGLPSTNLELVVSLGSAGGSSSVVGTPTDSSARVRYGSAGDRTSASVSFPANTGASPVTRTRTVHITVTNGSNTQTYRVTITATIAGATSSVPQTSGWGAARTGAGSLRATWTGPTDAAYRVEVWTRRVGTERWTLSARIDAVRRSASVSGLASGTYWVHSRVYVIATGEVGDWGSIVTVRV